MKKKFTRRAVLKILGGLGLRGAIGGGIGYSFGRVGEEAKKVYEETMKPVVRVTDSVGEKYDSAKETFRRWLRLKEENQRKQIPKEKPKSLIRKSMEGFYNNPVEVGTTVGTIVGLSTGIPKFPSYLSKIDYGKLKDKNVALTDKVEILEKYQTKLHERIDDLERMYGERGIEVRKLREEYEKMSQTIHELTRGNDLEKKVSTKEIIMIFGFFGIVFSLLNASYIATGFSIAEAENYQNYFIPGIIFILSLALIFIGGRK